MQAIHPPTSAVAPGRHQLALAAIVLALLPIAGFGAVWSADEGALLTQVAALDDDAGWTFGHPFPAADPDGTAFPLHLASWSPDQTTVEPGEPRCPAAVGGCRYIVLAKHTAFLWVTAGLYGLGGYPLILALSALSTVAAAVATSRLAGRLDPGAATPALWIAGLGSPLFFNSYIAWAHAPAAALIGWAVLGLTDRRRRVRLLGGLALFGACLLRTEAPLAGLAIGLGWLLLAGRDRRIRGSGRPRSFGSALFVLAVTVLGLVVDRLSDAATGGPVEPAGFDEAFGLIGGRIDGFLHTWMDPGYVAAPRDLLILVAATTTLAAAIFARRGPAGVGPAAAALGVAAACLTVRFLLSPAALIPGLVVAFPTLFAGLLVLDGDRLRDRSVQELLVPFVLFCGAVLATQYRYGGGGEWGGRYFAVGLPLGVAVATAGLTGVTTKLGPVERRRLALPLVVTMGLLSVMGLLGVHQVRLRTAELATEVETALQAAGDGDDRPVVVTTMQGLGRWLWDDLDGIRMLRVSEEDLAGAAERLESLGVEQLTFVSAFPTAQLPMLEDRYGPSEPTDEVGTVMRLRLRPSPAAPAAGP